ncbi:hypothetical protein ACTXIT_11500 [Corynebacterium casei]|uniref:hypothetical protein n=1 Tax=Corynebacterium casei TaxID=160386 RepID=UPI003FD62C46
MSNTKFDACTLPNKSLTARIPKVKQGTTEFSSMAKFLGTRALPDGQVRVWYGGLPIDFDVTLEENTPMLITYHGSAGAELRLPWFVGYGISSGLNISTVKFCDSSLYINSSLQLAWFAGNKLQPHLQDQLHKIVEKLSSLASSTKLVFFGGSGGGYAALEAATSIGNSTAIIFNPTTRIPKSNPTLVSKYYEECWDGVPASSSTLDLVERYDSGKVNCKVFYLQNSTDSPHIERHMRPLLSKLPLEHELYLLIDDWGMGHIPPPKNLLRTVLEYVVTDRDTFSFKKLGFHSTRNREWMPQLSFVSKRNSLAKAIDTKTPSVSVAEPESFSTPLSSTYLKLFDYPAGRNWSIDPLPSGGYSVVFPTQLRITVTREELQTGGFWDKSFDSQGPSNRFWLRSCWYAAEIARKGDSHFAMEVLTSYLNWINSNDVDPKRISIPTFDHCLALNLRTCAWLLIVGDLTATQTKQLQTLTSVLLSLASGYDRFLWNNHGIMLAMAMIHASAAADTLPPELHNLSRLSQFLLTVFNSKVSDKGLVRDNSASYQFMWAKWAWEIAHTFEYVLNEEQLSTRFVEIAKTISDTAALFGIDGQNTLPLGDGNRRSGPAYGPRKGIINAPQDGLLVINDGNGHVFSYTAGSPTASHRHVDDHALRIFFNGKELVADAGFNSFNMKDPVSRCVTSQRGHSGLYFPQFDHLPASEFYPANDPQIHSRGTLHTYNASLAGARVLSTRIVDEAFTTQRRLVFDPIQQSVEIHDIAHSYPASATSVPLARFLIPDYLTPQQHSPLRFTGDKLFIEFKVSSTSTYRVFHGTSNPSYDPNAIYGIICPRPGKAESAWVVEINLDTVSKSFWENQISIEYGALQ